MGFGLTQDQVKYRTEVRNFVRSELDPISDAIEKKGIFPTEIMKTMAKEGFLSLVVPKEFGGGGVDTICIALAIEEVSRASASIGGIMAIQNSVAVRPLILYGNTTQKDEYLTKAGNGALGAFALTEANAGSDPSAIETTARLDGTEYVINGVKQYITSATQAGFLVVMAMTDKSKGLRGISAFLVNEKTPGWEVTKTFDKMGLRAADNNEVTFTECRIPQDNLLGEEGQGFKIALSVLDFGRIGIAAQAVGLAQAAMEASIVHAKKREQFGKPIASFQGIAFQIADMGTRIEAARLLTHQAAYLADQSLEAQEKGVKRPPRFSKEAAMAKLFASETAMWVTTKAIQIHGGIGYMTDQPVERYFRDAKITEIYEGTSEIQRLVISRAMLA
ncbi:Acyl-CoA dehydrogenase [subsurface metagenome]